MKNRSEEILHKIGRKVVSGVIRPGEVLPKVEILSEDYNVSRTVVREALKGLSARKIVRSNKRSGTVVLQPKEWQWWDLDVMTWLSEFQEADGEILLELTDVRLGIEPIAAALAAQNATESDQEYITACYRNLENTIQDTKQWAKADYEFHLSVIEASHNNLMISLLQLLHKGLIISREKSFSTLHDDANLQSEKPTLEVLKRHRALYDAILSGDDKNAQEIMTSMILRAKELLRQSLGKDRLGN
ncbi:FadR/GntR family transcriptional regulator [Oceanobacillus halotolerans]|uniref:FadR/GntR family transcriptional regulator n=1 Tax=Oceanobacillus halotolerans TaxID=2663380 RepID=UPI0013DBAB80|nr:FadR/GntR family transcriptional regulator [Oceanobacillus halotolerans]